MRILDLRISLGQEDNNLLERIEEMEGLPNKSEGELYTLHLLQQRLNTITTPNYREVNVS